jgi:hypothetical protein
MPTGRHNLVSIGSTWLTKTGLDSGIPCKTNVAGLDALKLSKTGSTIIALDGTPFLQTMSSAKGLPVSIGAEIMATSVFDSVVTAIQTAVDAQTTLGLYIDGETGTFSLDVVPSFPEPIKFPGTFAVNRVEGVQFNFVVAQLHNVLSFIPGSYEQTGRAVTLTYSGA